MVQMRRLVSSGSFSDGTVTHHRDRSQRIGKCHKELVSRAPMNRHMTAGTLTPENELGDRLGDGLADRFLYHFVVRARAQQLLGDDDEWGWLPIRPTAERGAGPYPA